MQSPGLEYVATTLREGVALPQFVESESMDAKVARQLAAVGHGPSSSGGLVNDEDRLLMQSSKSQ